MKNNKSVTILDHYGFLYVFDFSRMISWVVQEEDEQNPVTALEIRRVGRSLWQYRLHGSVGDYEIDSDVELVNKMEEMYEKFINRIVVENKD